MKHPSLIEFRDKSDKANICNKRYETAKERAIRLEKEGTPTISICSDNFMDYARSLAKSHGADDLRIVEIKHPISGQKEESVREKATETIKEIKKLLNID